MKNCTLSGNSRTCGAWQRKHNALSLPAGDDRNASSVARNAGEWIERDSGDVSHSSKTRSWQRLHLLEFGNALSIVTGALPSCCAKRRSPTSGADSQPAARNIAAKVTGTIVLRMLIRPSLRTDQRFFAR